MPNGETDQPALFDNGEENRPWQEEWKGMPEFFQEAQAPPFHQITVRFVTEKDMEEFSKLIGQKLTQRTKTIWHPQIERGIDCSKRYVDEP